jgi:hypothetical protein
VKFFEARSVINARPADIWPVLTDGARYADWDSGVDRVDGTIAPGEKLKVYVKANPGRAFPVRVAEFKPDEMMRWTGGMPFGLFRGNRTYRLTPQDDGTTVFTMREEYTGPLLGLIWRSIPDLGPSFQQFADGLRKRVEAGR